VAVVSGVPGRGYSLVEDEVPVSTVGSDRTEGSEARNPSFGVGVGEASSSSCAPTNGTATRHRAAKAREIVFMEFQRYHYHAQR
jgi:hypothetical protein